MVRLFNQAVRLQRRRHHNHHIHTIAGVVSAPSTSSYAASVRLGDVGIGFPSSDSDRRFSSLVDAIKSSLLPPLAPNSNLNSNLNSNSNGHDNSTLFLARGAVEAIDQAEYAARRDGGPDGGKKRQYGNVAVRGPLPPGWISGDALSGGGGPPLPIGPIRGIRSSIPHLPRRFQGVQVEEAMHSGGGAGSPPPQRPPPLPKDKGGDCIILNDDNDDVGGSPNEIFEVAAAAVTAALALWPSELGKGGRSSGRERGPIRVAASAVLDSAGSA